MTSKSDSVVGWAAAAERTGLSVARLRRAAAAGQLASVKDDQGRHLFAVEDLDGLVVALERADADAGESGTAGREQAPRANGRDATDKEAELYRLLEAGHPLEHIGLYLQVRPEWLADRAEAWARLKEHPLASMGTSVESHESELRYLSSRVGELERSLRRLWGDHRLLSDVVMMLLNSVGIAWGNVLRNRTAAARSRNA